MNTSLEDPIPPNISHRNFQLTGLKMPPSTAPPLTKRAGGANPDSPSTSTRRAEDEEARPYVIVREIGKGSFATVYQGYHEVRFGHLS